VQDGCIYIEKVNAPFLATGGAATISTLGNSLTRARRCSHS